MPCLGRFALAGVAESMPRSPEKGENSDPAAGGGDNSGRASFPEPTSGPSSPQKVRHLSPYAMLRWPHARSATHRPPRARGLQVGCCSPALWLILCD